MCNDPHRPERPLQTGGYGPHIGRWYLRYIRHSENGPKETKKALERTYGPTEFMAALEEAKEAYKPIYEATRRQHSPTDPVSDPTICYESPLFPTI